MLRPDSTINVYLYTGPVDMRKSIDGLSNLVQSEMNLSPMTNALFVFCNRGRDKIKMLYWERNGFVVWYKRLEQQRFQWLKYSSDTAIILTGEQLNWLLNGLDIWQQLPHKTLHYDSV